MNSHISLYKIYIYEKFNDLINSNKRINDFNNNDLCKIFEYYSCIKLSEKYNQIFYEYGDIPIDFKENNNMSRNDTGIDASNLIDTIVQCKLRKNNLNWKECSTFFASSISYCEITKTNIIKWKNFIITRNNDSSLSYNLKDKLKLFIDIQYSKDNIINYCNKLILNPPIYPKYSDINFKLRDYQEECIDLIKNNNKNCIISLPTVT